MDSAVCEYLASKVYSDLRSGTMLSPALTESLTGVPFIDHLRKLIRLEDFDRIRAFCDSTEVGHQNFGLALLRNIESATPVREYLREMWDRHDLPLRTRMGLQFQLSNYTDLDPELRHQFRAFIFDNWQSFIDTQLSWCGTGAAVINFCRERLGKTEFPAAKRWLYLCVAAAGDYESAQQLVKEYENDPDPFTREVAQTVLKRLASSHNNASAGDIS